MILSLCFISTGACYSVEVIHCGGQLHHLASLVHRQLLGQLHHSLKTNIRVLTDKPAHRWDTVISKNNNIITTCTYTLLRKGRLATCSLSIHGLVNQLGLPY